VSDHTDARYYHPQLRRFLNQDTVLGSIEVSASMNRFAYANGNPISAIDPFGTMAQDAPANGGFLSVVASNPGIMMQMASTDPAFSLELNLLVGRIFGPLADAASGLFGTTETVQTQVLQQQEAAQISSGTADDLAAAANRAAQSVGPGSGAVYGTQVHAAFQAEVEALAQPGLQTEVSYINGVEVPYGTSGSVRIDVGQFDANGQIQAVFDLKTGSATLTPARIQQIQQAVGSQVPVTMIRP
jgi:hypothetical protein